MISGKITQGYYLTSEFYEYTKNLDTGDKEAMNHALEAYSDVVKDITDVTIISEDDTIYQNGEFVSDFKTDFVEYQQSFKHDIFKLGDVKIYLDNTEKGYLHKEAYSDSDYITEMLQTVIELAKKQKETGEKTGIIFWRKQRKK